MEVVVDYKNKGLALSVLLLCWAQVLIYFYNHQSELETVRGWCGVHVLSSIFFVRLGQLKTTTTKTNIKNHLMIYVNFRNCFTTNSEKHELSGILEWNNFSVQYLASHTFQNNLSKKVHLASIVEHNPHVVMGMEMIESDLMVRLFCQLLFLRAVYLKNYTLRKAWCKQTQHAHILIPM